MQVLQEIGKGTSTQPHHHPTILVFRILGARHHRALAKALGGITYVLIAIDKLTKWIEYKLVTTQSADRVIDFFCETATYCTSSASPTPSAPT